MMREFVCEECRNWCAFLVIATACICSIIHFSSDEDGMSKDQFRIKMMQLGYKEDLVKVQGYSPYTVLVPTEITMKVVTNPKAYDLKGNEVVDIKELKPKYGGQKIKYGDE